MKSIFNQFQQNQSKTNQVNQAKVYRNLKYGKRQMETSKLVVSIFTIKYQVIDLDNRCSLSIIVILLLFLNIAISVR